MIIWMIGKKVGKNEITEGAERRLGQELGKLKNQGTLVSGEELISDAQNYTTLELRSVSND
jgi:hypothetical protein